MALREHWSAMWTGTLGWGAKKAFERISGERIWTNVMGGDDSIFMDPGLSPLAAWAIGGF